MLQINTCKVQRPGDVTHVDDVTMKCTSYYTWGFNSGMVVRWYHTHLPPLMSVVQTLD